MVLYVSIMEEKQMESILLDLLRPSNATWDTLKYLEQIQELVRNLGVGTAKPLNAREVIRNDK